jgi:hypothetical protein
MTAIPDGKTNLGNHASPGDNMSIDRLACFPLMAFDGLQQAVEVLINGFVVLDKGLETFGQIDGKSDRRVVVSV